MSPKARPTHSRAHFFKYTTPLAIERILQTRELKWSAPDKFNDPFDHQINLVLPFTEDEAAKAIFSAQVELIFGPKHPKLVKSTTLGELSLRLREMHFSDDEISLALFELEQGANEVSHKLRDFQIKLNEALRSQLGHSRVLCVSEVNDNVVMWSHYADEHRGAVLKLRCVAEIDDNLMVAKPVEYVDGFPKFVSAKQWADDALGLDSIDAERLAHSLCYMKHKDWGYEQEWRVILPLLPHESVGNGIRFEKKDPCVFEALFLGCRMTDDVAERLTDLARANLPHMEIYRAKKSSDAFKLEFHRIS